MVTLRLKQRKAAHLVLGLLFAAALASIVVLFPPEGIWVKQVFFLLLFVSLFYLLRYVLNQTRRALLLSGGLMVYLILRAVDLRHWLYPLLIAALILSVEIYAKRK